MKFDLEDWVIYGNVLVGKVYGFPGIPNGAPMFSGALIEFDKENMEAETLSRDKERKLRFNLKSPGKVEMYAKVRFDLKPEMR